MGAKANLQTGSSEDINEVTGGPCTRPWPWSVPAVPCNKCNRLDSYCQHWRFCLGKVAACSSLLLGAKLLQLPVFIHDMNQNMCPIFFAAESPLQCWTIPGTGARQGPGLGCCYFLQLQNFADGFYNFMLCNFDISFHTERKLTWDTIKLNKCSLFVLTSSSSSGTAVYYAGSWWWPHPSLDPGQVPATRSREDVMMSI